MSGEVDRSLMDPPVSSGSQQWTSRFVDGVDAY
jgi:hypothetical protein